MSDSVTPPPPPPPPPPTPSSNSTVPRGRSWVFVVVGALVAAGGVVTGLVLRNGNDNPSVQPAPTRVETTVRATTVPVSTLPPTTIVVATTAPPTTSTVVETTTTTTTIPPTAPASTAPASTAPAIDPYVALARFVDSVGGTSSSDISTSSCGSFVVVVAPDTTYVAKWTGNAWQQDPSVLGPQINGLQSVADSVTTHDYTGDSIDDFLIFWQADDYSMQSFGGVVSVAGSDGCTWGWLPIRHPDGSETTFTEGLYDDAGTLNAMDFLDQGGKAPVYLTWDGTALVAQWLGE